MVVLILFIQIVSLVFYFKFLSLDAGDFYADKENSLEKWGWYTLVGLNIIFVIRFIFAQISYSYTWYDEIMELLSFGISFIILISTSIYYLIKRHRQQKRK